MCPFSAPQSWVLLCSHWQQSLQRRHFGQRWFSQVSLVQYTHSSVEGSPQMLHAKVVVSLTFALSYFDFVFLLAGAAAGAGRAPF